MLTNSPLVSICCQTYNHKNYISEAIESFLMQKTNFSFEILLRDDASTDGTAEICKDYTAKYPDLINLLSYEENQFSKGVKPFADNVKRARGKYIAICEGDDYWTDPNKLQKQVDLMESYPFASMCVALNKKIYKKEQKEIVDKAYRGKNFPLIYFEDLSRYFHTSTYLIRNDTRQYVLKTYPNLLMGDTSLRFLLVNEGPFVVLNELVSVYRITHSGAWTSLDDYEKDKLHYELFSMFRLYHVKSRRRYYARIELHYLVRLLLHRFRQKEYSKAVKSCGNLFYLLFKYEPLYFLKIALRKIKGILPHRITQKFFRNRL